MSSQSEDWLPAFVELKKMGMDPQSMPLSLIFGIISRLNEEAERKLQMSNARAWVESQIKSRLPNG